MIALDKKCTFDKRSATVVLLRGGEVTKPHFYLAQKKQNIHTDDGKVLEKTNLWNGYGGKWKPSDRGIYRTAIRELYEESGGVRVLEKDLFLGAKIKFFFPGNMTSRWDLEVFFFWTYEYSKYPEETSEMGKPRLFSVNEAPYDEMMPIDRIIIPTIMSRKKVIGSVHLIESEKGLAISHKDLIVAYS